MNQHWEYCWVQEYADDDGAHQQKKMVFCASAVIEHTFDRSCSEVMTLLGTGGWQFTGLGVSAHPAAYEANLYFKRLVQSGRRSDDILGEGAHQVQPHEVAQVSSPEYERRGCSSVFV